MRAAVLFLLIAIAVSLAGCATTSQETAKPSSSPARASSAPRYNLTGYSPAFKAGYGDACASPRRRSEARFKTDDEYRMGWQDGSSVCRAK